MTNQKSFKDIIQQIEDTLKLYLVDKAPSLPQNIKEILVAIAPWFTLIGVFISVPLILVFLGLGTILAPFAMFFGITAGAGFNFSVIFLIISVVFEALAIQGLFNRTRQGWMYVFYANIVSAVYSLVTFDIFGLIIGTLFSMYFLFQVREYYK